MQEQTITASDALSLKQSTFKALHVVVPEEAHHQARRAAVDSRMSFKKYMARLMLSAQPFARENSNESR